MSSININTKKVKQSAQSIKSISNELKKIEADINGVISSLKINSSAKTAIKNGLRNNLQQVTSDRQKLSVLSTTLTEIVALYNSTEKNVKDTANSIKSKIKHISAAIQQTEVKIGAESSCKFSSDPVNVCNGNYVYEDTYLKIEGLTLIQFHVFYNSQQEREGILGKGWNHNYETVLRVEQGLVRISAYDGSEKIFHIEEDTYYPLESTIGKLERVEDGYLYTDYEQNLWKFSDRGLPVSITDLIGNELLLTHDEKGQLLKVENQYGNFIEYVYEEGILSQVKDHAGRFVELKYDNNKHLKSVVGVNGQKTNYKYDENGYLNEIVNARGIVGLKNYYDAMGKVVKQEFPDGGTVSYNYDDENRRIIVTNQNGSITEYIHDEFFRNTKNVYADGEETFVYNNKNLKTEYVDKCGNKTNYKYDTNGNVSEVQNALGDELNLEYNECSQLKQVSINGEVLQKLEYNDKHYITAFINANGDRIEYVYNDKSQVESIVLQDGSKQNVEYDEFGNVISITNAVGGKTQYEYDKLHRVIKTLDALNNATEYEYDNADRLIKVTNALGDSREYEYDECGNLIKMTDFNGAVTKATYNNVNKPESYIDAEGNCTKYEYDKMWNVVKKTDANAGKTCYEYDDIGRVSKIIEPNGAVNTFKYDGNGNLIERVDGEGAVNKIEYDALNRANHVVDPCGREAFAFYDSLGNVTKVLHPDGSEDNYKYDLTGKCIYEKDRTGYEKFYEYDALGNTTKISDKDGVIKELEYYPGGLIKSEKNNDGTSRSYKYNSNENITEMINQDGAKLEFEYDSLQRVTKVTQEGTVVESYVYDALGRIISKTDGEGNICKYVYSPNGNIISVVDENGFETNYEYDSMNNLVTIRQEDLLCHEGDVINKLNNKQKNYRVTNYVRDLKGNVVEYKDAEGNSTKFVYDLCGRVVSQKDADNNVIDCEYYADGLEKAFILSDGKTIEMQYDALKQLVQMKDWLGITSIDRDEAGRPARVTNHNNETIEYLWGEKGEKKNIVYPNGAKVEYTYDNALRLMTTAVGNEKVEYSYFDNGKLKEKRYPDGHFTKYQYDKIGGLRELRHGISNEILDKFIYSYDNNGRKIQIDRSSTNKEVEGLYQYEYNAIGSLSKVLKNGEVINSYEYDAFGNRICEINLGEKSQYVYNRLNQLVEMNDNIGKHLFNYDKKGNLTEEILNGNSIKRFDFGADGMLNRVEANDTQAIYTYNGFGHRVATEIKQATDIQPKVSTYLYDVTKDYYNLLSYNKGENSANVLWDGELLGESLDMGTNFYMNDELMYPMRSIGASGIHEFGARDIFGNVAMQNEAPNLNWGITGYLKDEVGDLYFANRRHYSPQAGRFISRDPAPGYLDWAISLNPYAYCYGDPINYHDPSGAVVAWLAIGGVNAVANVAVKFAGDVVKSVAAGEWKGSSWQSYVGTAAGGFVQGATFAVTGNMVAASAAGAAVESVATNGLNMATGVEGYRKEDGYSWKNLVGEAAISAGTSALTTNINIGDKLFGSIGKYIKIDGINKGRGSFQAVWKGLVTKAKNGTINNISWNSILKGLTVYGGVNFLDSLVSNGIDEIKDKLGDLADKIMKKTIDISPFTQVIPGCPNPLSPLINYFDAKCLVT